MSSKRDIPPLFGGKTMKFLISLTGIVRCAVDAPRLQVSCGHLCRTLSARAAGAVSALSIVDTLRERLLGQADSPVTGQFRRRPVIVAQHVRA